MPEPELTISPIERASWEGRKERDPLIDLAFSYNAVRALKEQLDYIVKEHDFLVCYVWGAPNSGKSEVADSVAFGLKKRYEEAKETVLMFATFSFTQTLLKIQELTESIEDENVIFVQDEVTTLHGKGSKIAFDNLNNILRVTRAKKWSYLFSCPKFIELDILQFSLRTVGRDKLKRRNLVLLYDEEKKPVGYVWVPLSQDYEWRDKKYAAKMENINRVLSSGGYEKVEGLNWLLTKEPSVVAPYEGQTANLRQAIFIQLAEYGIIERDIEIFKAWVEGENQREIADRLGFTQSWISDIISNIKRKALGYTFEDVYYAKMKKDDDSWVQGGKNTPDPDLYNSDRKLVISCKCYADKKSSVTIPFNELAQSELDLMKKGNKLELIFYNILWDKLFVVEVTGEEKRFSFRIDS